MKKILMKKIKYRKSFLEKYRKFFKFEVGKFHPEIKVKRAKFLSLR